MRRSWSGCGQASSWSYSRIGRWCSTSSCLKVGTRATSRVSWVTPSRDSRDRGKCNRCRSCVEVGAGAASWMSWGATSRDPSDRCKCRCCCRSCVEVRARATSRVSWVTPSRDSRDGGKYSRRCRSSIKVRARAASWVSWVAASRNSSNRWLLGWYERSTKANSKNYFCEGRHNSKIGGFGWTKLCSNWYLERESGYLLDQKMVISMALNIYILIYHLVFSASYPYLMLYLVTRKMPEALDHYASWTGKVRNHTMITYGSLMSNPLCGG